MRSRTNLRACSTPLLKLNLLLSEKERDIFLQEQRFNKEKLNFNTNKIILEKIRLKLLFHFCDFLTSSFFQK